MIRSTRWLTSALLLVPACSVYNADLLAGARFDATTSAGSGGMDNASDGGGNGDGDSDPGMGGDAGSGGRKGSGGKSSGGMGGMPPIEDPVSYELIDDMEDNDPDVLLTGGRNGRWNTYNDGTGTQVPAQDFSQMTALTGDTPPGSAHAAYTSGEGFSGFGAVLNVTMRSGPDYATIPPYDATPYTGLSFFAKAGAGANKSLRLRLVTTDTDPRGLNCAETGDTSELCFDHFTTQISLSEDWTRVDVSFLDFSQTGAGKQFPAVALDGLYAIEFLSSSGSPFEFWIDDLSFIDAP